MKALILTLPDGSQYSIPVDVIAHDRAKHYAHEFGGDVNRSLLEDTGPLFECDNYAIKDWAANNMNWSDAARFATKIRDADPPDFQDAWINGKKSIAEIN